MASAAGWVTLILLGIVFLGPLAGLLAQLDGATWLETLQSPGFRKSLMATITSGGGGALLSILGALLFARHFALYEWRFKRLQRLLLLIPYLVPNFILASAYVTAWNPESGQLNSVFPFPFGLYGLWGMTLLFGITHLPVAFLVLEEKFRRIDPSWREAARLSGASSLEILFKLELPLILPSMISSFGLCFALNISAFAIPAWISAPSRVYPLTYKIYQAIQVGGAEGIPQAAAYSLALFLLALVPLALGAWAQRQEKRLVMLSGKASRTGNPVPSARAQALFQGTFASLQLAGWIFPLCCLILSTLVRPGCLQSRGLSCLSDLSLQSYRYVLFDLSETRLALHDSLLYGTLSALLIMALSIGSLVGLTRAPGKRRVAEWIFALPLSTPGAIIAIGLIVTASGRFGLNLYNTPYILMAAFVIKHLSLAFQPLRTGLSAISGSLVEAARLSGASSASIWSRILLPILKPELLGGFFLVLVPILGELSMSVFLASPRARTIGTVLFDLQDYADQASAGALSVLLVLMILLLNETTRLVSRGKLGY